MKPLLRARLSDEAGMALAELLITAVVLAMFLLMTDRVFTSVNAASRTTQRATDLQQNARVAALRLRREIRESSASAVSCYPDPTCRTPSTQVVFPSARPSDAASVFCLDAAVNDPDRRALDSSCTTPIPLAGTYAPVWQRYIGYHVDGAGGLRRVVQSIPIALPMPITRGQICADQIVAFIVSREGQRFHVRIESLNDDVGGFGGSPVQRMQLEDTITLRNAVIITAG